MSVAQFNHYPQVNTVDNYSFLQNGLNELYIQAIQAEKYAFIDGQSSLAKMRLFVELACHELGKYYDLRPPVHGDLASKIKQLQALSTVDRWVIDLMNRLRSYGNQSLHICESNGHFVAQMTLSESRMRLLLQDMHELAKYLANKLLKVDQKLLPTWQENPSLELAESVTLALSGDAQSSYAIAKHFVSKLSLNEYTDKQQRATWQHDVKYWSEKALQQGCTQSWLLQANCFANKQLLCNDNLQIKALYKKALKVDKDGEAHCYFGLYLIGLGEKKLGIEQLTKAVEMDNHQAIFSMQLLTYKNDSKAYLDLIKKGIDAKHKASYTLDLFERVKAYENDAQDELAFRALRSALITAEAMLTPGMNFFKAYAAFLSENKAVSKPLTPQECADMMVASYESLPMALEVESRLLTVIAQAEGHNKLVNHIFVRAMEQTQDVKEKARLKSVVAIRSIEQFKETHSVSTPMPLRQLLQEAANDGDAQARAYLNSSEGKALLKKGGFCTTKNVGRTYGVQKAKDRKKSKAAKKARRK
ncbi:hypothetical protein A9264_12760 [Vibrio sp. UCD-FRSSP16_10]|uniref:DUF4145 domain-containing protein n=1 Tax=unclassified Vibrio TaxID=2614977 RepID=UPI0008021E42|nr:MULTISPECIES: DUF4145 domain-containing protein [unclassified Vibrio]OBT15534.1 hypothetical protein A9260_12975 [Vibrio sp. UCD-FRSSP16_30]OBT20607.1 hypothetical protein A9264_12760 [Vibrio sp. UCD-FRSSP16_10]